MNQNTILIVEDEEGIAALERLVLEKAGFQVEEVRRGGEALELLAKKEYALVVLDYQLPDMTGADVIAALGERARSLPIVVVTGYSDPKLKEALLAAGANDFIVKGNLDFLDKIPRSVNKILSKLAATSLVSFLAAGLF